MHSRGAALAAEAMGAQTDFWTMHDYLFEHQKQLEEPDFQTNALNSCHVGRSTVYSDRKGVKRRTGLPASSPLSSSLGSPRSSLDANPVARMACPTSPRWEPCSIIAAESR